jgi:hypothetical protein
MRSRGENLKPIFDYWLKSVTGYPSWYPDIWTGHFCNRAHDILVACKAFLQLCADAWAVFNDRSKKSLYDNELSFFPKVLLDLKQNQ